MPRRHDAAAQLTTIHMQPRKQPSSPCLQASEEDVRYTSSRAVDGTGYQAYVPRIAQGFQDSHPSDALRFELEAGMADMWSAAKRSDVMSRIRSFGNRTTELRLIQIMKEHRITGWRRHQPLPGRPDFAFRPEKVAVFVDGCFWHGCPKCYQAPTSNSTFWKDKVTGNRARDKRVTSELRASGWRVLRLWEHDLRQPGRAVARLRRALGRDSPSR